jgi:broad specificity phosphatase PhoE
LYTGYAVPISDVTGDARPASPGPTRLLLVRHGETDHNAQRRRVGWIDSPLSGEGERQAARLAEHLAATERIDVVYASTLQRAVRTAEAIAARLGLAVRPDPHLREWHLGECEGTTDEEVEARYPGLLARGRDSTDLSWGWPGGEDRRCFYDRARRAVDAIAAAHPGQSVLVVAHNALISSWMAQAIESDAFAWPAYLLDNCGTAEVLVDPLTRTARLVVGPSPCPPTSP